MIINTQIKGQTFGAITEADMFIYNGMLFIKRDHMKDNSTYNAFRVGKPQSGVLLGPHETVIPVTEITVS